MAYMQIVILLVCCCVGVHAIQNEGTSANSIEDAVAPLVRMLVFPSQDTDQDGYLSFEEMKEWIRKSGGQPSEEEVRNMYTTRDANGDGRISLSEMAAWIHESFQEWISRSGGFEAFTDQILQRYDVNGDNQLSFDELQNGLTHHGYHMDEGLRRVLFNYVDRDHNGQLNQEEFSEIYRNI